MRNLLRAALCAAILAATAGPLAASPDGENGPAENAAVTKFCVTEPGFLVTLLFVIRTREDLKRCHDGGFYAMGVWDLQFFLHLPEQIPALPGPSSLDRGRK